MGFPFQNFWFRRSNKSIEGVWWPYLIWVGLSLGGLLLWSCAPFPVWAEEKPKHHTDEGFRNFPVTPEPASLGISFFWRRILASFNTPEVPEDHFLSEKQAIDQFQALRGENTVTWIGQSTLLIRLDGKIIITDPFLSDRASPFPVGPERFIAPGISSENLPPIDMILISHNHYDHLDEDFIEAIPNKESIHVFVPLKLKSFFSESGFSQVHELDWYETHSVDNIQFTALPMVHYSGRGMGDRNKSLWCSWAINNSYGRYYFIGDSTYSPSLFKEIGEKFGKFDLAMVPIGTYGNRKYGVNNHTTPEEALQIGNEINAKALLGIHWGTIDLSEEDPWEPPVRFKESAQQRGFLPEDIWVMKIGETRRLPGM